MTPLPTKRNWLPARFAASWYTFRVNYPYHSVVGTL